MNYAFHGASLAGISLQSTLENSERFPLAMLVDSAPYWKAYGDTSRRQEPYDVAVVMPTVGRESILRALESVFIQGNFRIQVLIGVDAIPLERSIAFLEFFLLKNCPSNVSANVIWPGYSTSVKHGGLHPAKDGGALRCILSYMANSNLLTYLDDDNYWHSEHLSSLLSVMKGFAWGFSLRNFCDPISGKVICVDEWESVGPNKGVFNQRFGGFVDPNQLILDRRSCWPCLPLWNIPLHGDAKGMSADRNIFNFLKAHSKPAETQMPTVFYRIDLNDSINDSRQTLIAEYYRTKKASE